MEMRKFGKTILETSTVVFGGGFVGGIIIHADDDTRRKAIRMALDGRINWIDTAPIYGQGKSEEALGWLLEEVDEELMECKAIHRVVQKTCIREHTK